jgi:hypothetical protein
MEKPPIKTEGFFISELISYSFPRLDCLSYLVKSIVVFSNNSNKLANIL